MRYIVLSPIGKHRRKTLVKFVESIRAFSIQPEEIVFCRDYDDDPIDIEGIKELISPEISVRRGELERIASAREILRKYFVYKTDCEFALWIDCDIICPPNLPDVLYDVFCKDRNLVIVNRYRGRGDKDKMWCGSGVMLTHRNACTMSRFFIGKVDIGIKIMNLSEDFMFFSIFDQGRIFLEAYTDYKGRVCREYVKVEHIL